MDRTVAGSGDSPARRARDTADKDLVSARQSPSGHGRASHSLLLGQIARRTQDNNDGVVLEIHGPTGESLSGCVCGERAQPGRPESELAATWRGSMGRRTYVPCIGSMAALAWSDRAGGEREGLGKDAGGCRGEVRGLETVAGTAMQKDERDGRCSEELELAIKAGERMMVQARVWSPG